MSVRIASIVEGDGEVESLPILIRRIAHSLDESAFDIDPAKPILVGRQKVIRPGELERYVELAAGTVGVNGGILLVLDSDDDCPAQLGPELLNRMRVARGDIPSAAVLAHREYEAWFLAAAESLRGKRDLPADLAAPDDPESIRGAKEWLGRQMQRKYISTRDQPALTAAMDLAQALRARSFAKFHREIVRLCGGLRHHSE